MIRLRDVGNNNFIHQFPNNIKCHYTCFGRIIIGGYIRVYPNYLQLFNMLAETNLVYQKEKAISPQKNGLFDIWLPETDSNRQPSG